MRPFSGKFTHVLETKFRLGAISLEVRSILLRTWKKILVCFATRVVRFLLTSVNLALQTLAITIFCWFHCNGYWFPTKKCRTHNTTLALLFKYFRNISYAILLYEGKNWTIAIVSKLIFFCKYLEKSCTFHLCLNVRPNSCHCPLGGWRWPFSWETGFTLDIEK